MLSTFRPAAFLLITILLLGNLAAGQAAPGDDFTIIVLPDTQRYSEKYPHIFNAQTKWIVDNRDKLNIRMVIGVGDIVHNPELESEWQNADAAVRTLDGQVPYALAIGNHDYEDKRPSQRKATSFNRYFGPARYQGYSWYKGHHPSGSNENFYVTFRANGRDYLVLVLEFHPRESTLDWARKVLAANRDKEVLYVSHSYMFWDDTRINRCDTNDMNPANGHYGETVWERFISQEPNIIMALSGHINAGGGAGTRQDIAAPGQLVNQMLSNYQSHANGGNGYLRILRFRPSLNTIEVTTYSPWTGTFYTDSKNQFTLPYYRPSTSSTSGSLVGRVVDTKTCANIASLAISTSSNSASTNSAGKYSMSNPPGASVAVRARKEGWQEQSKTTAVHAGYSTTVDFFMSEATSSGSAPCPLKSTDPSVTICTPSDGAGVSSPVRVVAGTTSSSTVNFMQIYLDGTRVHHADGSSLDAAVAMEPGTRRLTVQAKNSAGTIFKETIHVNVGSSSGSAPCTLKTESPSVTICTPSHGAAVSSPVRVMAGSTSPSAVNFMQIYLDGSRVYHVDASSLDTSVPMQLGERRLTVQAKNSAGSIFKETIYVNVGSASSPSPSSCTISTVDPSVTICTPASESTVSSPARVVAETNSSSPVRFMQIYLDGVRVYHVDASRLDTSIAMSPGRRRVTVQARNEAGTIFNQVIYVNVQ